MKLMICLLALLCIASAHPRQQAPQLNEKLAYARLVAAEKLPTVTHAQCFSAQGDWLERDKTDKESPYWYEKVSTEELVRIASLSTACANEAIQGQNPNATGATSIAAFVARSRQFDHVLLDRAESVLHNHSLIEEYLLQP
jgi:hypothetical protein